MIVLLSSLRPGNQTRAKDFDAIVSITNPNSVLYHAKRLMTSRSAWVAFKQAGANLSLEAHKIRAG